VHALLDEAEAWVSSEREGTEIAEAALRRCGDAVRVGEAEHAEALPG
jgi:hypothetical protein